MKTKKSVNGIITATPAVSWDALAAPTAILATRANPPPTLYFHKKGDNA
jgi:hypothetical protein